MRRLIYGLSVILLLNLWIHQAQALRPDDQHRLVLSESDFNRDFYLLTYITPQMGDALGESTMTRIVRFKRLADGRIILQEIHQGHVARTGRTELILGELTIVSTNTTTGEVTIDLNRSIDQVYLHNAGSGRDHQDPITYDAEERFSHHNLTTRYIDESRYFPQSGASTFWQKGQVYLQGADGSPSTSITLEHRISFLERTEAKCSFQGVENRIGNHVGYFETPPLYAEDGSGRPRALALRQNLSSGTTIYYISPNTPEEYREAISQGVLYWNHALGRQALDVRVATPSEMRDPTLHMIEWLEHDQLGYARAAFTAVDPLSGLIMASHIAIPSSFVRVSQDDSYTRALFAGLDLAASAAENAGTASEIDLNPLQLLARTNHQSSRGRSCPSCNHLCQLRAPQQGLQSLLLKAQSRPGFRMTPEILQRLEQVTKAYLAATIAHEVGHTLGLRHNMAGRTSGAVPPSNAEMALLDFLIEGRPFSVGEASGSSSIMDYASFFLTVPIGHAIYRQGPLTPPSATRRATRTQGLGRFAREFEYPEVPKRQRGIAPSSTVDTKTPFFNARREAPALPYDIFAINAGYPAQTETTPLTTAQLHPTIRIPYGSDDQAARFLDLEPLEGGRYPVLNQHQRLMGELLRAPEAMIDLYVTALTSAQSHERVPINSIGLPIEALAEQTALHYLRQLAWFRSDLPSFRAHHEAQVTGQDPDDLRIEHLVDQLSFYASSSPLNQGQNPDEPQLQDGIKEALFQSWELVVGPYRHYDLGHNHREHRPYAGQSELNSALMNRVDQILKQWKNQGIPGYDHVIHRIDARTSRFIRERIEKGLHEFQEVTLRYMLTILSRARFDIEFKALGRLPGRPSMSAYLEEELEHLARFIVLARKESFRQGSIEILNRGTSRQPQVIVPNFYFPNELRRMAVRIISGQRMGPGRTEFGAHARKRLADDLANIVMDHLGLPSLTKLPSTTANIREGSSELTSWYLDQMRLLQDLHYKAPTTDSGCGDNLESVASRNHQRDPSEPTSSSYSSRDEARAGAASDQTGRLTSYGLTRERRTPRPRR